MAQTFDSNVQKAYELLTQANLIAETQWEESRSTRQVPFDLPNLSFVDILRDEVIPALEQIVYYDPSDEELRSANQLSNSLE